MMLTHDGMEMSLSPNAEVVCTALVQLGAVPTSGHRTMAGQAATMAKNVAQKRDWIGKTYIHGAALQGIVDAHPEWVSMIDLGQGLYRAMVDNPTLASSLSHHLQCPCAVFDLDPDSVQSDVIVSAIEAYVREGVITKVLYKEGGLKRCHIECAALPKNKMEV